MKLFAQADGKVRLELDRTFRITPRTEVTWQHQDDESVYHVRKFTVERDRILISKLDSIDWDYPVSIKATQVSKYLGRLHSSTITSTIIRNSSEKTGDVWGEWVTLSGTTARLTLRWRLQRLLPVDSSKYQILVSEKNGTKLIEHAEVSGKEAACTIRVDTKSIAKDISEVTISLLLISQDEQKSALFECEVNIPKGNK